MAILTLRSGDLLSSLNEVSKIWKVILGLNGLTQLAEIHVAALERILWGARRRVLVRYRSVYSRLVGNSGF